MTRTEFLAHIEETFNQGVVLIIKKNSDYAGDDDPFQNFGLFEYVFRNIDITKCDKTALAIFMRILDKMQRQANLLAKEPSVVDEKMEDTTLDIINYEAILNAFLYDKKNKR